MFEFFSIDIPIYGFQMRFICHSTLKRVDDFYITYVDMPWNNFHISIMEYDFIHN